jgi:hypothetical protein
MIFKALDFATLIQPKSMNGGTIQMLLELPLGTFFAHKARTSASPTLGSFAVAPALPKISESQLKSHLGV